MTDIDKVFAVAHAQLVQAREELTKKPTRGFQDAFLEALRPPYETASLSRSNGKETEWRQSDLRKFLILYFPQYAQQPAAFSALCASLARKAAKVAANEGTRPLNKTIDKELVVVTFDRLKCVLMRQYGSTRLVAKDPFPLQPCVAPKPGRHRSIPPFLPGPANVADDALDESTSFPLLYEFRADVLKKPKSWLARGRARHLLLRWGVLEIHKRSLGARSFLHHSSGADSNFSASGSSSRVGDGSTSTSSTALASAGAATVSVKMYDLQNLMYLKLEHVNDGEVSSARKAALTLKFRITSSNSPSKPSATANQDIKTLILGGGEASDILVSVRDHLATFALYLELSRRDRLPSMTKVRNCLAAGAMVNVRVRLPRILPSKDSREGSRRRSQAKQLLRGSVTALQLAFLQDPRVPSFESTIALLLNAGADPKSLLYWDYATQVLFTPPSAGSDKKEASEDHHQRQRLRKRLLLLKQVESEDPKSAVPFSCFKVQADDGARWNLLMFFCWLGDFEGVKQLLIVMGAGSAAGNQGRSSERQQATCLDHVNAAGDTALHVAIKSGKESVALLLVEAALAINAQTVHQCDARGEPVVHLALIAQQWRVVDALVAGGAVDPRSYDAVGNTALHLAIQLCAPLALIARIIQVYRHSPPTGGLDAGAGRRGSNDTPLSLALKSGQQEVVALLLASGASPSGSGYQWGHAFIERQDTWHEEGVAVNGVIGDDDSALHVAIKAGMELAAAALIVHKADIYAVDSRGASSLALAVRYGLYALAAALVDQHQKRPSHSLSKHWWVDGETGKPVVMLAFQAGQLELAAFLLDCIIQDKGDQPQMYPAQLLSLLVQISSRLSRSGRAKSCSGVEWKQQAKKTHRHEATTSSSFTYEDQARSKEDRDACKFLLGGIQSLVVRFLHLCEGSSATEVVGEETVPSVSLSPLPLVVHLPTIATPTKSSPPNVFKGDESAGNSPLHVAASGGPSTFHLLRLLLAFLSDADARVAAQILVHPMGSRAETSLHAALAAGAADNALLLLYSSRELRVREPEVSPLCAQLLEMTNSEGNSALHLASAWPHSAAMRLVVELLLQEHVNAENWNNAGLASLHIALREECDDTFIELLLQYGQDFNLWTEGSTYGNEGDGVTSEFSANSDTRPSAMTLAAACPRNPLMLALESENAAVFRALVRGGARTRAMMPRARIGLLQLAVHLNVRNPELLACLLDDPELEHVAKSNVADRWGVSPHDARTKLMDVWRKERSGVQAPTGAQRSVNVGNSFQHLFGDEIRPSPLHAASDSDEQAACNSLSAERSSSIDASTHTTAVTKPSSPLRITIPRFSAESVLPETAQYLRALPRPPKLSPMTLEYLREEERATLTLVAKEAWSEAQDWLRKRIGQKKLLSDAHAQLQNAKKHRRTASGSSVSSSKDESETSTLDGGRYDSFQSDHQLLEELKAVAAKAFIDKHVAEAVAEAQLSIEREKQTIFQETGLYPGMTSKSKKNARTGDGKHRSLLVRAASSTTGSILLPASSASMTSFSSEEGSMNQLSDDGYGSASFWWSDRGTTSLSDDTSLSWLPSSNLRGGSTLGDPTSTSVLS